MAAREKCTYCPALVKPKFREGHERDAHYSKVRAQEVKDAKQESDSRGVPGSA